MLCMGFEWHLLMYRGVMSRMFQEVTSIVSVYTIVMGAGSRTYGALPVNVLLIQGFSALERPPGINTSSIEFTIRNDKMYFHSLSYLGNDMAHVVEIRSDEGQGPVYCASSTSWLLMTQGARALSAMVLTLVCPKYSSFITRRVNTGYTEAWKNGRHFVDNYFKSVNC